MNNFKNFYNYLILFLVTIFLFFSINQIISQNNYLKIILQIKIDTFILFFSICFFIFLNESLILQKFFCIFDNKISIIKSFKFMNLVYLFNNLLFFVGTGFQFYLLNKKKKTNIFNFIYAKFLLIVCEVFTISIFTSLVLIKIQSAYFIYFFILILLIILLFFFLKKIDKINILKKFEKKIPGFEKKKINKFIFNNFFYFQFLFLIQTVLVLLFFYIAVKIAFEINIFISFLSAILYNMLSFINIIPFSFGILEAGIYKISNIEFERIFIFINLFRFSMIIFFTSVSIIFYFLNFKKIDQ